MQLKNHLYLEQSHLYYLYFYFIAIKGFLVVVEIVTAISTFITVLKDLQIATAIMTGIQWALNVAMSANPIVLVVLAIAALIAVKKSLIP